MKIRTGAILVTGASSGVGKACALRLEQMGYTVFAGVRKQSDELELQREASSRLIPVILDVTDEKTIASAVERIQIIVGAAGLVALINNAGIGVIAPIELVPLEELRRQFEVNVIGQVAVIQAFLSLIRQAHGRIINIGSVGGKLTMPFAGPLCASKYALEAINDALRMELLPWDIPVILVRPISTRTAAVDKLVTDSERMVKTFSNSGSKLYTQSFRLFTQSLLKQEKAGVSPEVVAEVILRAITAHSSKKYYTIGFEPSLVLFFSNFLPAGILDSFRTRLLGVPQRPAR